MDEKGFFMKNETNLVEKIDEIIKSAYKNIDDFENFRFEKLENGKGFMVFSAEKYSPETLENIGLNQEYPYKNRYYYGEEINNNEEKTVVFILFNCSSSDPNLLDDSVKNCKKLAEENNYGRIDVINLFSVRNPNVKNISDKELSDDNFNLEFIKAFLANRKDADIVCAWGYGKENLKNIIRKRVEEIKEYIKKKFDKQNIYKISVNLEEIKGEIESKDRHPANQAWSCFIDFTKAAQLTNFDL